MNLVIVESPAKCGKIESYLGAGYKCIASFGHIREIANGLKSIDFTNNYRVSFKPAKGKSKYISNMRKAISNAKEVILATDDDREGEAIAWHICKMFNLPLESTKRIIFHEITKPAIRAAIQNPTFLDINKVNAQQARQVLDLLVGFIISPILWQNISRNSKSSLSAGRCQTPALRLVYDQQQEINNSPGKKVYNTEGIFTKHDLNFVLNHNHNTEKEVEKFLEDNVNFDHKYNVTKPRQVKKNPPKPFTTSLLQQKSSNEFHYSPKMTMKIAQNLYEGGYITYMRTDSAKYSKEFVGKAQEFINKKYDKDYINKNIENQINNKKKQDEKKKKKKKKDNNAQEAHEAIRPTKIERFNVNVTGKITGKEVKLYNLIWKNTIESCMSPAIYNSISATITAPEQHKYRYTSEEVVFLGWKIIEEVECENPIYRYLLTIKNKTTMDYKELNSNVTLKDLKKNYTEARLVQMLEKKGIGRPSTFSSLIDKIQQRQYVNKMDVKGKLLKCTDFKLIDCEIEEIKHERVFGNEKNKLVIQPLGIIVYEFLAEHFDDLFNYNYTKNMEEDLDKISRGEKVWYSLCDECNNQIKGLSKNIKSNNKRGYVIDEHHTYMVGKYGPVIKYEKDGETKFKNVRKDIDIEKLKNKGYKLEEILETQGFSGKNLGNYKNNDVILKKGKYGLYISYDGKNLSIKHIDKGENEIVLDDIKDVLDGKKTANKNVIKVINENISIRKGKYGPYVFYKTSSMKKPKFIKIAKNDSVESIDEIWVNSKL